jgi:hypothetical protein
MRRKRISSAAERQARFRARHLGVDGGRARLNMIAHVATIARLERLARHWGITQIEALERALATAERPLVDKMSAAEERRYYDGA